MSEIICDHVDGSKWLFEDGVYRREKDGILLSRISGKNIPDPVLLWEKRCKVIDVNNNSEIGVKLKPANFVFSLFEDWSKRNAIYND